MIAACLRAVVLPKSARSLRHAQKISLQLPEHLLPFIILRKHFQAQIIAYKCVGKGYLGIGIILSAARSEFSLKRII